MGIMKKLFLSVMLAGALVGCKTEYPPTEADDRGVVEPKTISNEKANAGDPKLPDMTPWWKY